MTIFIESWWTPDGVHQIHQDYLESTWSMWSTVKYCWEALLTWLMASKLTQSFVLLKGIQELCLRRFTEKHHWMWLHCVICQHFSLGTYPDNFFYLSCWFTGMVMQPLEPLQMPGDQCPYRPWIYTPQSCWWGWGYWAKGEQLVASHWLLKKLLTFHSMGHISFWTVNLAPAPPEDIPLMTYHHIALHRLLQHVSHP